jgi:cytochrome c oxidase subunit IV
MSDSHSHAAIAKHVKVYITVFIALLVGTLVTVGMYAVHFESVAVTILIALFIATVKAALVAGFFMHLVSEKKAIYAILIFTAFFFAGLMALTLWSMHDFPALSGSTEHHTPPAASASHVP